MGSWNYKLASHVDSGHSQVAVLTDAAFRIHEFSVCSV